MILNAMRLLRSLSAYHYTVIIFTILVPSGLSLALPYFVLGLIPRIISSAVGFLVWAVVVCIVMALMLNRDKTKAERHVDRQVERLERGVDNMAEELKSLRDHFRDEVNNLEETVRLTLKNQLSVDLPPRIVSGRARAVSFQFTASAATGTATGGSRVGRIRLWVRRVEHRIWKFIYGS